MDADGNFVDYADIAVNPPPHIHLPRGQNAPPVGELQLPDLGARFPNESFVLRQGTGTDAKRMRVTPAPALGVSDGDEIVMASPLLTLRGKPVPAAIGKLRLDRRTDAASGEAYVMVTLRGPDGLAQARMSEDEWNSLTTLGLVQHMDTN